MPQLDTAIFFSFSLVSLGFMLVLVFASWIFIFLVKTYSLVSLVIIFCFFSRYSRIVIQALNGFVALVFLFNLVSNNTFHSSNSLVRIG